MTAVIGTWKSGPEAATSFLIGTWFKIAQLRGPVPSSRHLLGAPGSFFPRLPSSDARCTFNNQTYVRTSSELHGNYGRVRLPQGSRTTIYGLPQVISIIYDPVLVVSVLKMILSGAARRQ